MGLDMYLTNKIFVAGDDWDIKISKNGKPSSIDCKKINYIEEEIGYWRKANAIHKWFVANVQSGADDCGTYHVSKEKIEQLINYCKEVLETPSKASNLLPTASGFFFGSTEYDEWYFDDLKNTIKIMQRALQICNSEDGGVIYYHSSW